MTQMKRATALLLALSLALCALAGTTLAADVVYPVGGISGEIYGWDDGAVDMSHPLSSIPYGKAFYVPLLNEPYLTKPNQDALKDAVTTRLAAWCVNTNPVFTDMGKPEAELRSMQARSFLTAFEDGKKAAEDAVTQAGGSNAAALARAAKAITDRAATYPEWATVSGAKTREAALKSLEGALSTAVGSLSADQVQALLAYRRAHQAAGADAADLITKYTAYKTARGSLSEENAAALIEKHDAFEAAKTTCGAGAAALLSSYSAACSAKTQPEMAAFNTNITDVLAAKTVYDAVQPATEAAATVYADAFNAKFSGATANADGTVAFAGDAVKIMAYADALAAADQSGSAGSPLIGALQSYLLANPDNKDAAALKTAKADYDTALAGATGGAALIAAYEGLPANVSDPMAKADAIAAAQAAFGADQKAELAALTPLLQNYDSLSSAGGTATPGQIALRDAYAAAVSQAEALYQAKLAVEQGGGAQIKARAAADPYPYVYETAAGQKTRANGDWEVNRDLVKSVEVLKRKMSYTRAPGWFGEPSKRYAYFLVVTLKPSNSTSTKDLYGVVRLRKSGSYGFDFEADLSVEVCYNQVSDQNTIPRTPALFEEGSGFTGETDEIFYFEEDPNSTFTVNTTGQNKLLLGMNTDYDADISDRHPDANLEFWNGNGRSFNKIGLLSLAADEGSYLYQVNGEGALRAVQARYDSYEEAFQIKTRTLGRYVVSDKRLKLTDQSGGGDSGSGSGSDSGSDSGVVVTPVPPTTGNINSPTGAAI